MNRHYYETLYNDNKSLVSYVISKMSFKPETYYIKEEMFAAAYSGLDKAVHVYDCNKYKTAFSTFAVKVIKNSVLQYLLKLKRSKFQFNVSLNNLIVFEDESSNGKELIDYIEDDVQNNRDNEQEDKDNIQDILAAIVTCANKRDQELFIRCEILGYSRKAAGEMVNISGQAVDAKIKKIKQKVKEIVRCMDGNTEAPCRKQYTTSTEWRREYAKFYLKSQRQKWEKNHNRYYEESPLINKCFPCAD